MSAFIELDGGDLVPLARVTRLTLRDDNRYVAMLAGGGSAVVADGEAGRLRDPVESLMPARGDWFIMAAEREGDHAVFRMHSVEAWRILQGCCFPISPTLDADRFDGCACIVVGPYGSAFRLHSFALGIGWDGPTPINLASWASREAARLLAPKVIPAPADPPSPAPDPDAVATEDLRRERALFASHAEDMTTTALAAKLDCPRVGDLAEAALEKREHERDVREAGGLQ